MIGLAVSELPKRIGRVLNREIGGSEFISARSGKALINGVKLAMAAHACFLLFFIYIDAMPMARFNILSLLLFGVCLAISRYPRNLFIVLLLFVMEVSSHAVVAVNAFGWDSGYHYYLFIFVPFIFANEGGTFLLRFFIVGVLCSFYMLLHYSVQSVEPSIVVSPEVLTFMFYSNVAGVFASVAYLASMHRMQVLEVEKELKRLANTDTLTGLKNRRHLLELVDVELTRRQRSKSRMSVAVMDIDNFKVINDNFGHDIGDFVLVQVAKLVKGSLRRQDYVARWGGEEFLILLPETGQDGAFKVVDSIRRQIAALHIFIKNQDVKASVSIGVAEFYAEEAFESAFVRADNALLNAKTSGKNKVVIAE